jgi:hypothetical protein
VVLAAGSTAAAAAAGALLEGDGQMGGGGAVRGGTAAAVAAWWATRFRRDLEGAVFDYFLSRWALLQKAGGWFGSQCLQGSLQSA